MPDRARHDDYSIFIFVTASFAGKTRVLAGRYILHHIKAYHYYTMTGDDRLIYQLSRAHYRLSSYLQKELVDKKARITQAQAGILFLLEKGPLTMTEISQRLDIDNSAITGVVDRLEKADFASRTSNPEDRRTFLISISEKGKKEIDRARPIIKEVNREIKAGFSDEEIDSFKRVLNSLYTKFNNRKPVKTKAIS